jgi:hypothetical protein
LNKRWKWQPGPRGSKSDPVAWITKERIPFMLVRYMAPNTRQGKRPRRRRHQIVDGRRAAVLRALTAVRLLERGEVSSLVKAARACGSNPAYVAAGQILRKTENAALVKLVLAGEVGLLEAASGWRRMGELVHAYRRAELTDRAIFGRIVGAGKLFDEAVVPTL